MTEDKESDGVDPEAGMTKMEIMDRWGGTMGELAEALDEEWTREDSVTDRLDAQDRALDALEHYHEKIAVDRDFWGADQRRALNDLLAALDTAKSARRESAG